MATKIVTKNSSTASAVPTASDLVQGELAVNVADKRLFTEDNAGAIVELGTNPSGNVTFQDNGKAIFGAGSDLQIYHDGLNSYIVDAGTGDLYFRSASNLYIGNAAGTQSYITAADGGAVDLRYNGAAKLATTSTGIDVIGSVTADGLTVTGTNANLVLGTSGNDITFNRNADNYINASGGTSSNIIINPQNRFVVNTGGSERMRIDSAGRVGIGVTPSSGIQLEVGNSTNSSAVSRVTNGTVSVDLTASSSGKVFLEVGTNHPLIFATNATERMRIDSAGQVGIGTTAPSAKMHVIGDIATSTRVATDTINGYTGGSTPLTIQTGGSQNIILGTNATERMRIDSSGNVGIGTSPNANADLHVADTSDTRIWVEATSGDTAELYAGTGVSLFNRSNSFLNFGTNNTERMRIDSSGNLLVGKNSAGFANTGHELRGGGSYAAFTRDGGPPVLVNRKTSDGTLVEYMNDGSTVGQINARSSDLVVGTGDTGLQFYDFGDAIFPLSASGNTNRDGAIDLGESSNRFKDLHLSGTAHTGLNIHLKDSGTTRGKIELNASDTDDLDIKAVSLGSNMKFFTVDTERMRIDSSGNLLVGQTSNAETGTGIGLVPDGTSHMYSASTDALMLGRGGSDGDILSFNKSGTTVGSVGVSGGNNLYISSLQTNHAGLTFATDAILPTRQGSIVDNVTDLGASSERFQDIYATNGTIQTSDRNEKQDIEELSDAEQRVAVAAKGLLRKFRWKDSVAEKGDEARVHFGIIAQDLQAAFAAEGLDAGDYAMFISTTWTDEETNEEKTRMGVRYSELLAFIIAAL